MHGLQAHHRADAPPKGEQGGLGGRCPTQERIDLSRCSIKMGVADQPVGGLELISLIITDCGTHQIH